jgi:hypothetical protein
MVNYPIVPNGTIDWYVTEYGHGGLGDIVSNQDGVRKAVQGKAEGMAREAAALLSVHRHRGNAAINVTGAPPRMLDAYVELRDADPGGEGKAGKNKMDRSAMSIEFGWTTKTGKEVPGLHILGTVMKRAARKYRGPK